MTKEKQIEIFEQAFSGRTASCRLKCECGKTYFDDHNGGYDWERGELEALRAGEGIAVDYAPGSVEFEGRHYVNSCTCWHERAGKIMGFIDGHAHAVACYLNAMKKQRLAEADAAPVVG
jgi:hypothetical protein